MGNIGIGIGLGSARRGPSGPAFDPTDFSPDALFRSNFAGSPWVDEIAARNAAALTGTPTAGTAQNGHTPVDLGGATSLTITGASNVLATSAWSMWFVVQFDSLPADPGAGLYYTIPNLFSETGTYVNLACHSNGVSVNTTGTPDEITVSTSLGTAYHLIGVSYSSNNLRLWVDGLAPATKLGTAADLGSLAGNLNIGAEYSNASFIDGRILEMGFKKGDIWTYRAQMVDYVNSRYALSL